MVNRILAEEIKKGLVVVAHPNDVAIFAAGLILQESRVDWSVLCVMGASTSRGSPTLSTNLERFKEVGLLAGFEVISGSLVDRGPWATYSRDAEALGKLISSIIRGMRYDVIVTYNPNHFREHLIRWHVYNAVSTCVRQTLSVEQVLCFSFDETGENKRLSLTVEVVEKKREIAALFGLDPKRYLTGQEVFNVMYLGRGPDRYSDLRRMQMHGQVVQYPESEAPGILISPFWGIPQDRQEDLARLFQNEGRAQDWYVIFADTSYHKKPPRFIFPMVRGRFSVDEQERSYFARKYTDIDMLPICQSHFIDRRLYRVIGGEKKYDLIYNARFGQVKRHQLLLDALKELKRRGERMKTLLMYYPKEDEDTRVHTERVLQQIEGSQLDVTLFTTGVRGRHQQKVVEMLNQCRFGVHLSLSEGPSMVFAEYLLCGLPVVVYEGLKGGGLYFIDESNGRLFASERELPDVLLWMRDNYQKFTPRQSTIMRNIGYDEGNALFKSVIEERGIHLSAQAVKVPRYLSFFSLADLFVPSETRRA